MTLFFGGRTRSEILSGTPGRRPGPDFGPLPDLSRDTLLYACGVEWPAEYDWKRDSCIGRGEGTLVLMRWMKGRDGTDQFVRIREIPASAGARVSTDTDMHHLLKGHLYSEYSGSSGTCLRRDGVLLYEFDGRYLLKGLLEEDDGTLYALWQGRSGSGIRIMRNSELLLSREGAVVFSGMDGPGFSRSGALLRDESGLHFAFRLLSAPGTVFFWHDGEVHSLTVELERVLDARMIRGTPVVLGSEWVKLYLAEGESIKEVEGIPFFPSDEAYLFDFGGELAVCLSSSIELQGLHIWSRGRWDSFLYPDDCGLLAGDASGRIEVLGYYPDKSLIACFEGWKSGVSGSGYYFRYPSAVSVCGKKTALAATELVTSRNEVWTESGLLDVPLGNGCLTGVEYVIETKSD